MIYLDNAATSLQKPKEVEEEISCLKNMIIEAQSYNYNVEYFK